MPEYLGHAPLLLTLLMGNNNNNAQAQAQNYPTAGTVVANNQLAEVDFLNDEATELGVLRLHSEGAHPQGLTQAQRETFDSKGYLVLPDVLTVDQATALLNESRDIMKRIAEGGKGIIRHDVSDPGAEGPSPIGRVLATFEPGDDTASDPFKRRVCRLGCAVHKIPTFRALTHAALNRSIADSLGYKDARITQGQLIAKLAGVGSQIVPHQDGCVSFTNPPSALTFWYALEDTTIENGCLCVAAGSHLTTPLRQRCIRGENGLPTFVDVAQPLWARVSHNASSSSSNTEQTEYKYQALEVKKGTLVLFHGNLMHKSGANKSEKNRIAYTFSIVEGNVECPADTYVKPVDGEFERL